MSASQTSHFDAIYTHLPPALKAAVDDLLSRATRESAVKHTLDQLVRLSLGREATDDDLDSREEWDTQGCKIQQALSNLHVDKGKKRAREEDHELETKSKKAKVETSSVDGDDTPVFTLHTVSVSSPVRKKVHITIYGKSIRFTHATTGAQEASLPLSSLTRAFLISTPGKTKPHWTVVIFTEAEQTQIIFGLDAVPPSLSTTTHPAPPHSFPKGTESKPALTELLSHLPAHVKLQEPSTAQFRSAGGDPYVDAYLRAKDGHLLFFKDGILFGEKKPCMWIGMEEIDSVRSLSATGRTFSLFVKRVADNVADEEEEDDGDETEFSLIDGKNQDAVARWVQDNRHRFGVRPGSKSRAAAARGGDEVDELAADGDGDEDTPEKREGEDEDLDDSDFEGDSDSDGGSASSGSSDEEGEGGQAEPEEDGAQSETDEGEGEGGEENLSESKHPLLRPGAMPKMSKAAINAVVGMVEEDMMGAANGKAVADENEDQLDELED